MKPEYRPPALVTKAFHVSATADKENISHPALKLATVISDQFTDPVIRDNHYQRMIETALSIRLMNDAVSTILTAINVAKEKSIPCSSTYYHESDFTVAKDYRNSIEIVSVIRNTINILIQKSSLEQQIDEHNSTLSPTNVLGYYPVLIDPVIIAPPPIKRLIMRHSECFYAPPEIVDVSNNEFIDKIIILLSIRPFLTYTAEEKVLEKFKFGTLHIHETEMEGNVFTPRYEFGVNNYIFGVINLTLNGGEINVKSGKSTS